MKKYRFLIALIILNVGVAYSQEIRPLYQLPSKINTQVESESDENIFLVGSDSGLFKITSNNNVIPLWTECRVDQLSHVRLPDEKGVFTEGWFMRTENGLLYTVDLVNFEERNNGLPLLTIKRYDGSSTVLEKKVPNLKDFCVNPVNNQEMVTATKDNVYYSNDGGKNWTSLSSYSAKTPGIKAVAIATLNGESVVFMSHPMFGLAYAFPNRKNKAWKDIVKGFDNMRTISTPDEIADILPVVQTREDGTTYTEIYLSQSYLPRLYKLDWDNDEGILLYEDTEPADCYDGLTMLDDILVYSKLEGIGALNIKTLESPGEPSQFDNWNKAFSLVPGMINSAWIPSSRSGFSKGILLSELWLLYPGTVNTTYAEKANGRKAIYASSYQCRNQQGIDKFKKVVKDRNMNAIVIDMKDDYGYLRYETNNSKIKDKATVSSYAIDLEHFVDEYKKENIYLIARIPVFKDRELSKYQKGKYAIYDKVNKKNWVGIKNIEDVYDASGKKTGSTTEYYDEYWVDPYSEEVWEYNVEIAKELISRGFDEIQFDYIRFPTDGWNLSNAQYRWQDEGMDKESALISFLIYARENINAPIGIDIYGTNGWYRSGARTGQDTEMLCEYVDVIGPMFYPSHFEQNFLDYKPYEDRTYRIYYYGSFRNTVMARNRVIVRPWVQSFYMSVSYDMDYYNEDYIRKEFFGVRDSINHGYMCWNNAGEYGVTPPDITDTEMFTGEAPEASWEFKKPAIGTRMKPLPIDETDLSILDSILNQGADENENKYFSPLLINSDVKRYHN